jgi:hypothetical protein
MVDLTRISHIGHRIFKYPSYLRRTGNANAKDESESPEMGNEVDSEGKHQCHAMRTQTEFGAVGEETSIANFAVLLTHIASVKL